MKKALRVLNDGLAWSMRNLESANAMGACGLVARNYAFRPGGRPKILIGTHHKVLTVYFLNVFRRFALITNRSIASSHGGESEIDYGADILRSTHSRFDFGAINGSWFGLHVVRDPRDLLVSAAKYHVHSDESWLHVPREEFGGKTYQQTIGAIESMEDRLIFEIDHATRGDLNDIITWDYNRPGIAELRYEELIQPNGIDYFRKGIEAWGLEPRERTLLCSLFEHFSIHNTGTKKSAHIRNPKTGQWRADFTPRVAAYFEARFPGAVAKLGYEPFN